VIEFPYGILELKQGLAGLSQKGIPNCFARSRSIHLPS